MSSRGEPRRGAPRGRAVSSRLGSSGRRGDRPGAHQDRRRKKLPDPLGDSERIRRRVGSPSATRVQRTHGDRGGQRQGEATGRPQPRRLARRLHPDRRRHQLRQLGGPAAEHRRRGDRDQHGHQQPGARDRVRHPHQHGEADHGSAQGARARLARLSRDPDPGHQSAPVGGARVVRARSQGAFVESVEKNLPRPVAGVEAGDDRRRRRPSDRVEPEASPDHAPRPGRQGQLQPVLRGGSRSSSPPC